MSYIDLLTEKFPVRKSKSQKAAFRAWAAQEGEKLGYTANTEENGFFKHKNLVFGDPEHAAVVFTAHYDTPAVMLFPNLILPKNPLLFLIYQLLIVLLLLLVSVALPLPFVLLGLGVKGYLWTTLLLYSLALVLMVAGKANKHNVNDNTSGVAAVLETMAKIPENRKKACAFILFDNEEKGKLGSKAYAKNHQMVQYMKLIVNLDCVGNGDAFMFAPSKMAPKASGYGQILGALMDGNPERIVMASQSMVNSDQASFKCGAAVCACKKKKLIGYYTPNLHTGKDTYANQENIDFLSDRFARAMADFGAGEEEE